MIRIKRVADIAMNGGWKVTRADSRRSEDDRLSYATRVDVQSCELRRECADGGRNPDVLEEPAALPKTKWNHGANL